MRLFLLPISTRRTILYCQKFEQQPGGAAPSLLDRASKKANETWAAWEKKESGWQKKVTEWGNVALRRIPFEEWGLKTVPPLSARRRQAALDDGGGGGGGGGGAGQTVEVLFPSLFLRPDRVPDTLRALATERQALHRRRLIWSLVGIPVTLPFALVPVVPNLPGFYLAFRAYSHYKALRGSQHLEFLVRHKLCRPTPSPVLDDLYARGLMASGRSDARAAPEPTPAQRQAIAAVVRRQTGAARHEAERDRPGETGGERARAHAHAPAQETMLLQKWNGKLIAERFRLPDMEVEIERAVEQVERDVARAGGAIEREKREVERVVAEWSHGGGGGEKEKVR